MSADASWFVVLAIDKEPIRGLIEGVIPATYKPTSEARWCIVKTETKARAIEAAEEAYRDDLVPGESVVAVSIGQICDHELVE